MNATLQKFGYPGSLVKEHHHWCVLLRPQQVTLGSLILAAKSDATAFSDLPPTAFAELAIVVTEIEQSLRRFNPADNVRLPLAALRTIDQQATDAGCRDFAAVACSAYAELEAQGLNAVNAQPPDSC
jgi:hypothetical protein